MCTTHGNQWSHAVTGFLRHATSYKKVLLRAPGGGPTCRSPQVFRVQVARVNRGAESHSRGVWGLAGGSELASPHEFAARGRRSRRWKHNIYEYNCLKTQGGARTTTVQHVSRSIAISVQVPGIYSLLVPGMYTWYQVPYNRYLTWYLVPVPRVYPGSWFIPLYLTRCEKGRSRSPDRVVQERHSSRDDHVLGMPKHCSRLQGLRVLITE